MPDVQSEIQISFEILSASLAECAAVGAAEQAALMGAFTSVIFGSRQAQVEALLAGPVGRPMIPVTGAGAPEVLDCWVRVLAAVQAYNALDTGLQLVPDSQAPADPPVPHCITLKLVDGQYRWVFNYAAALALPGRSEPVYPLSQQAGVARQVLAMGHVAIVIPHPIG